MLKQYKLDSGYMEMSHHNKKARLKEFKAPATIDANNTFGRIEVKVREDRADRNEIHLWARKLSVGIILNHYRLSRNIKHPAVPVPIDDAVVRALLKIFQKNFDKWCNGNYERTEIGSSARVKVGLKDLFFAHLSGIVEREISETRIGVPFSLIAIGRGGSMDIVTTGDEKQWFESNHFRDMWESSGLAQSSDIDEIRCGLAAAMFEGVYSPLVTSFYGIPDLEHFKQLAHQLGVAIVEHEGTLKYTSRKNPNVQLN